MPATSSPTNSPGLPAPAVRIRSLHFSYSKNEEILRDVNLEANQGDFMAILGPNGGGKTTLIKLILGLLAPDSGEIEVYGARPTAARGRIGYVPQFATTNLDFPATALDVVLMGAAVRSPLRGAWWSKDKASREKAAELLAQNGLEGMGGEQLRDLSGGQKQRVLVARALMGKPDNPDEPFLLLLDEPTANIDPQGKYCFYDFLRDMHSRLCVIVVSHDLALAAGHFNKIALVNRDLTLFQGGHMSQEVFETFFGSHHHDCPLTNIYDSLLNRNGRNGHNGRAGHNGRESQG